MSIELPLPNETFNLVGHEVFESTFLTLWKQSKLPHAFLFTGQFGIGKATLAYRIARYILNQSLPKTKTFEALENYSIPIVPKGIYTKFDTPASKQVTNKSHPNLLIIERSINDQTKKIRKNIVIDDAKKLAKFLHMTPGERGWRVVIIDTVDDMNLNASNAILKLLEEPPSKVLFLLISNSPGNILPTIRSRCQKVTLNSLSENNIRKILNDFEINATESEISAAFGLSEGSFARALEILTGDTLDTMKDIIKLLEAGAPVSRVNLHALSEKWLKREKQIEVDPLQRKLTFTVTWLSQGIRTIAKNNLGKDAYGTDEISCIRSLIERLGVETLCDRLITAKDIIDKSANFNLDRRQTFYSVMLSIAD
jgi:DNA polymerase-3 subunit delta'